MEKSGIYNMIDRRIIESFSMGLSIDIVKLELGTKINNFTKVFEKDSISVDSLINLPFNELGPARTRYGITYIKHCKKRLNDLTWIEKNKFKFKLFSNSQIFGLVQLKDKLSRENCLPF